MRPRTLPKAPMHLSAAGPASSASSRNHLPVVPRAIAAMLVSLLASLLPLLLPMTARAAVDIALAVEQLNDDDRRCQLSDDGVRTAAVAGLTQQAVTLVDSRSPWLFYLEAGGLPAGERCAYTLVVRLLHLERYPAPHPLFGEARASLVCSDGLRGLDAPAVGAERVMAGLTRIVAQCAAQVVGRSASTPDVPPADRAVDSPALVPDPAPGPIVPERGPRRDDGRRSASVGPAPSDPVPPGSVVRHRLVA